MQSRAAVAWEANKKLSIETIEIADRGRRSAGRGHGDRGLPHRRLHAVRRRSEGMFPAILGHEGAGIVREVGAGVTIAEAGRPRHPALHARVPAVQNVPVAADQPLHRDPRDPGPGPDAGRHQPLLLRRRAGVPLHGLLDLLELHGAARDRAGEGPRGRAVRQDLLHRLRRDHGHRRGDLDREGRGRARMSSVFGLGGIGLNVIQGARMVGADKIVGVDLNPAQGDGARSSA